MFPLQHKGDKERVFKGVPSKSRAVDLMVIDIPEGLPVPGVSSPPFSIPLWNTLHPDFLKSAFDFASSHVPDDGALLIFHSDATAVKSQLKSFCRAYHFKLYKKWIRINYLHLSNSDSARMVTFLLIGLSFILDCTIICILIILWGLLISSNLWICFMQTLCFGIQLLVRNFPDVQPSRFRVHVVPGLENSGINVNLDDVLRNGVTKASQLMNGDVPWRGPREKDPGFMQILIESFSLPGDTVFDCSAGTGL